jgi:serine/threonine protein kinase
VIDIGSVVNGKYRVVRTLGDGGMGSVYEAQHAVLATRVAIKVLHPELVRRTGLVERFLQEARVVAQIRSLNVVQVIDVDRTPEGHAYIVMELLEGEPLSTILDRQRRLSVPVACDYASQVLAALEAAHALGVIHRDLKPENVIVTFVGRKPVLKLIDFGIAKARRTEPNQRNLTVAGVVMGTAEYMAPEQARSAESVDARADLYAVGVMLYEMIAGTRPVRGDTGEDARVIGAKVERGEVVPLVRAAPDAPREIAGLVHRAMAARPEMRFATAGEMRLALEAASTGRPSGSHTVLIGGPGGIGGLGGPPRSPSEASLARATSPASAPPREPRGDTFRPSPVATALVSPLVTGAHPQASASAAGVPRGYPPPAEGPKGTGRTLALVALPLMFVASVGAILVGTGTWKSAPPEPLAAPVTTAVATPRSASPAAAIPAVPAMPEVPNLVPVRAPSGVGRAPSFAPFAPFAPASRVNATEPDAGPVPFALPTALPSNLPAFPGMPPIPAGFPTALPSGFPTALPSGFPVAALPSGFPTALPSAFPTSLPSWPSPPAPSPSASTSVY